MTGESGGAWPTWLCETVGAIHLALDRTASEATLGAAIPDELGRTATVRVAWIGQTTAEDVRVRSLSSDVGFTGRLGVDGAAGTLTGQVETTGQPVANEGPVHPDTSAVLAVTDQREADIGSCLGVPLQTDGESYGVLHLSLGESVQRVPDVLASVARTVARRLRAFEERSQLTRERERLESLRSLVSHDFGNPLNIASGRVELAARECESPHLDQVGAALARVDRLANRGVELVEVGWPPETVTEISLSALAGDCWEDVGQDRGTMHVEDTTIRGDRERIRMLLDELVRNAFDHSDGEVTVELGPLPECCGFYVADDGPGIPEEEREYVLDTGYTTVEDKDGTGFSIVTEVAGAHGWDVVLGRGDSGGTRVELVTSRW